jgi:EmrB/QacA subfamily drug resistance transporter
MHSPQPDPRRWKALALLCSAFFMVILDSAIVIVALPSIETDLGLSTDDLQWVLSAYLLSFGGLLLLGGRSADLLGRRSMFMVGTGLFALASLGCGLAWSGEALIVARVIQGVAAAIMTPTALSIVMTTFQEGSERNKALGVWSMVGGAGATAAWLVGGPITSELGWEWIFLINVPIGLGLLALSPVLLAESRATDGRRAFDFAGALTVTAALVLLVYAVVEAPETGWGDPQTIGLLAGSLALMGVFAAIEARSEAPLAPLRIFRSRALVGGNLVLFALGMLAFGMPFILTQYAQQVLDYSPIEFGVGSVVMPVTAALGSAAGQSIVTRSGFRAVAAVSLVLTGAGCALLTQVSVDGTYLEDIFFGLLVFGPGLGAGYVAGSVASLAGVAEQEAGLASGLNNSSFQIGGAVGVAILSTVAVSEADAPGRLAALTEGSQAAFTAAIAFAAIGVVAALALLGKPGLAPRARPAPETPSP